MHVHEVSRNNTQRKKRSHSWPTDQQTSKTVVIYVDPFPTVKKGNLALSSEQNKQYIFKNNAHTYDFHEEVLQTTHSTQTHQIEVIMDTGATFSMLPGHFEFAWTNLKPCLHTIEGCFKGGSTNDQTQMGEFHALLTLDSDEVRRMHHHPTSNLPPTQHGQFLPSSCHTVPDCGPSLHLYPTETKNIIQRGRYKDNERH
jgi:hypothetical protein